jgi:hypothetical protein
MTSRHSRRAGRRRGRGEVSGQDVLTGCALALGGRPHQAIHLDDGDITAIA